MYAGKSRLQSKGTIILSPHADDAALSIGGMLCKRILEEPITLVTIFGRSNYIRGSAFQSNWETVTATRKSEDVAFTNAININLKYLEFPEASLRLGSSFNKIFSENIHIEDQFFSEVLTVIKQIIDNEGPKFLFAPLGLGLHQDHLIVNRLSHKISTDWVPFVVYYEDLPYAANLSEKELLQHISSICSTLGPVYVSIDHELQCKLTNLMLYQSQIGEFELEVVRYYAAHWKQGRLYERAWASAAFPA
jgi:LmbE family N-acetylglucosaminyl deacetylase